MTNRHFNHFHESSFCADNSVVTVVPSFSYSSSLPLLSSQKQDTVGPFVAGMPVHVPLWMAKVLRQRQLAQINVPDWLSPETLTAILQEEKQSADLTTTLPFYYYEIARSLQWAMESKSVMILLQDLTNVRVDKIRKHFHELSKGDLQENEGELPMISVTGIASIELNMVGPFLQCAFSDYGYLTQAKSKSTVAGSGDSSSLEKENFTQGGGVKKAATMARSRLRRFRS
jgi:GINS complex subunit 2